MVLRCGRFGSARAVRISWFRGVRTKPGRYPVGAALTTAGSQRVWCRGSCLGARHPFAPLDGIPMAIETGHGIGDYGRATIRPCVWSLPCQCPGCGHLTEDLACAPSSARGRSMARIRRYSGIVFARLRPDAVPGCLPTQGQPLSPRRARPVCFRVEPRDRRRPMDWHACRVRQDRCSHRPRTTSTGAGP